jgi:hypothetical protein
MSIPRLGYGNRTGAAARSKVPAAMILGNFFYFKIFDFER